MTFRSVVLSMREERQGSGVRNGDFWRFVTLLYSAMKPLQQYISRIGRNPLAFVYLATAMLVAACATSVPSSSPSEPEKQGVRPSTQIGAIADGSNLPSLAEVEE